jgi:hypothetical protein
MDRGRGGDFPALFACAGAIAEAFVPAGERFRCLPDGDAPLPSQPASPA